MSLLAYSGHHKLLPRQGATVVVHAETENERISEKTIINYEAEEDD